LNRTASQRPRIMQLLAHPYLHPAKARHQLSAASAAAAVGGV
jgi:hypothetical protein